MTFRVHMLRYSDGSYYLGHTDNLENRVARHQAGEIAGYAQSTREEAHAARQQIKGWSRKKKEALMLATGRRSAYWRTSPSMRSFDRLSPYSGRTEP